MAGRRAACWPGRRAAWRPGRGAAWRPGRGPAWRQARPLGQVEPGIGHHIQHHGGVARGIQAGDKAAAAGRAASLPIVMPMPKRPQQSDKFADIVSQFGAEVARKLRSGAGHGEAQLRDPFARLLAETGKAIGVDVLTIDETPLDSLGIRPDFMVSVAGARVGYAELKARGRKVPTTWAPTAREQEQWDKLRHELAACEDVGPGLHDLQHGTALCGREACGFCGKVDVPLGASVNYRNTTPRRHHGLALCLGCLASFHALPYGCAIAGGRAAVLHSWDDQFLQRVVGRQVHRMRQNAGVASGGFGDRRPYARQVAALGRIWASAGRSPSAAGRSPPVRRIALEAGRDDFRNKPGVAWLAEPLPALSALAAAFCLRCSDIFIVQLLVSSPDFKQRQRRLGEIGCQTCGQ